MSKKDDYFAKMDSQIKKWDAEVDKLRAKSEQMGAEARAKFAEQLEAMRATRDAAFKKLEELHGSSESAWRHLEVGVDTAWASMKNALESFRQVQEVASRSADFPQQRFAWKPDCNSHGSSSRESGNRSRQNMWRSRPWRRQLKFMYRTSSGAAWTRPAAKTGRRSPDRRSRSTWSGLWRR